MSIEVTDATFDQEVLQSEGTVLVDFWAPWCGPCRMLAPIIDGIAKKTTAKICKLNVDDNAATAQKYNITGIPTVMIFKNGQVDKTFVGVQPEKTILDALQ